jgi:polyhydroxyalkanoate synthase
LPATRCRSNIKIPVYNLATKDDHIAPARSVFLGSKYFGGKVEYVLTGSGHIAGVVNPPQLKKYQYWTGSKPVGSFEDWMASAKETAGSWWPHWHRWVLAHDARQVKARKPGKGVKVLGDAPGAYVKVRV